MLEKSRQIFRELKDRGISEDHRRMIESEIALQGFTGGIDIESRRVEGIYGRNDFEMLPGLHSPVTDSAMALRSLDDLLEKDKQREADGFPKRIRIGKLIRPVQGNKSKVVVVPTTHESKFYHDDSISGEEEGSTGGTGEGEEGEVIGEQVLQPQPGEGEGQGAGQGEGAGHDISSDVFDLGKVITEKFELPNLKNKGTKRSLSRIVYDLTDRNRGFGQVLDKKATLKRIVETNILLGNIREGEPFDPGELLINPLDHVYRVMSSEKDFESQAAVFFLRDYSGSMQGEPTEVVSTQHLLIYSWLMYQYSNQVMTRFILHDTEAKEVPDFYTYYRSQVAGGTRVAPAFQLVNQIVIQEQLARDYNIYVFHGTDGDDWDEDGKEFIEALEGMMSYVNRVGITVAKNSWSTTDKETTVEKSVSGSGLLTGRPELMRIDAFRAAEANEDRIIEGIKKLIT